MTRKYTIRDPNYQRQANSVNYLVITLSITSKPVVMVNLFVLQFYV
jgi:hypothetical protein